MRDPHGRWARIRLRLAVAATVLGVGAGPAAAVFSGDMSPRAPSGDPWYARGMEAFERRDWPAVVDAMAQVTARRPHHDNAWARLGYAHRKLERYEASLFAYGRALQLNPHNRAALEYLGEAYVELGRFVEAVDVLERLAVECRRVELTFSDGDFGDGCEEYAELKALIDLVGGDTNGVADSWGEGR